MRKLLLCLLSFACLSTAQNFAFAAGTNQSFSVTGFGDWGTYGYALGQEQAQDDASAQANVDCQPKKAGRVSEYTVKRTSYGAISATAEFVCAFQ